MADLLSYALTTVADVKESMGIDAGDTSKDNLIKRKINLATMMIESYCNLNRDHHFKETTYTDEVIDGSGINQIVLGMRPVSTLSAFSRRTSGEFDASYESVESNLYSLDTSTGIIDLLFSTNVGFNTYKVTYTAGYSTIPADLAEACVMLAQYLVENSATGTGVKSKREGARQIEYFDTSVDSDSLIESLNLDDILNRYVNYSLAY